MNDPLGLTALPNLHPAVVHFPIALLVTAAVLDLLALAVRRQRWWLDRTAVLLYLAGAAGAGATYLTGRQAEDSLINVPPSVQPLIAQHADWALRTLLFFALLALARIFLLWFSSRHQRPLATPVRLVALALGAVGVWLLVETADRGGALVYRHRVAVAAVNATEPGTPPTRPPVTGAGGGRTHLQLLADGSLRWNPAPEDSDAIGTVLVPTPGASGAAVRVRSGNGRGLTLDVDGSTVLVLPGSFGDLQVEVLADLSGFSGSFGLAHHVTAVNDFGVFVVASPGRSSLSQRTPKEHEVLDESPSVSLASPVQLSISVSSGHLKGMVDGKTVAHGHRTQGKPGPIGLLFEGKGVVRLFSLTAVPLAGNHAL